MSDANAFALPRHPSRRWQALVLGRAGLDLYPDPDGCKIRDAESFSADLGGSAGNIAVAMARAGARVGLISGLSRDAVGDFVRRRLAAAGADTALVTATAGNQRTSLALAEVRADDCEVVIYRNDPADLAFEINDAVIAALGDCANLVVTGTSLIDAVSRRNTLELMALARRHRCPVWFDLDYRAWNWPDFESTRAVYREAGEYADVVVGNEQEFAVLDDAFDRLLDSARGREAVLLLKRGAGGCSLFAGNARLDSGIYPLEAVKPYGAGDAFLGNLLARYLVDGDWQRAIRDGSAAAALVVARRGCASAMPTPQQVQTLTSEREMVPAAKWS